MIPKLTIKVEYSHRVLKKDMITITSPKIAYDVLTKLFNPDTIDYNEECLMLCLNRANDVVGFYEVSKGGTSGTIVDPKVVLTLALNTGSSAIILAHNHPSRNLKPSAADEQITEKVKKAASYFDIKLIDHLIITSEGYYSFLEEGTI